MSTNLVSDSSSIVHMRISCLCKQWHVMVLREVIGVLFEPPWSVLRGERGCLLEVLLLLEHFKLSVFRIELRRKDLVVAEEAYLL